MVPRLRIDISWSDLTRAAGYCVWTADTPPLPLPTAAASEAIVTLSVRSAFDRLLSALELPAGSEVMLSEVTVPHMERIVREHGLMPVAVPVAPRTLHVEAQEVAQRLTDRTRLLVVAHLFGARMPLEAIGELCESRGVLLVEDCAQAIISGSPERHPSAGASLYSFGPIKTATALGGGIALVRDRSLRERMHTLANAWPQQRTLGYFARIAKIAGLKLLAKRPMFTLLVWLIDHTGGDADALVGHSARGYPDERLFECLRQRPCAALRHLIAWRLSHFDQRQIAERTRRGQRLAESIQPPDFVAGCDNASHTYWVFPLVCEEPTSVVESLRRAGLDASQISGLAVVGDAASDHWFRRTVFVPCGGQVPELEFRRAVGVIRSPCMNMPSSAPPATG